MHDFDELILGTAKFVALAGLLLAGALLAIRLMS
jgi:hypothetical protein